MNTRFRRLADRISGGVLLTAVVLASNVSHYTTQTATVDVPDQIFADGFENGDLTVWSSSATDGGDLSVSSVAALVEGYGLHAALDDNLPLYVTDDRPDSERRYRMRVYFDPNSIGLASGDAHFLFYGHAIGTTATVVLRLEFRYVAPSYQIRAGLLNDGKAWTDTAWVTLSDTAHFLEVDWRAASAAGSNNGGLTLWLDGIQQGNLDGIDNDTRTIDRVQLGAVAGVDSGTRGTYFFDAFESRRTTYIGPIGAEPTATPTATATASVTSTATRTPTATPTPTASGSPTPNSALPDLVVVAMSVTLETGSACSFNSTQLGVRAVVKNVGSADAGPFVLDVNGVSQPVSEGLAAGQQTSRWFAGYASGENTALADAAFQVVEGNEGNNQLTQFLPVPTLPPTCTPAASATPTPTATSSGTPTATRTPSPSATASPTHTPTPTRTPTPTATITSVVVRLVLTPAADAYVNAANPNTNFGLATQLRSGGAPVQMSYLRFVVGGVDSGMVTTATLRLYANGSSSAGYTLHTVPNNTWGETTLTYANRPATGVLLGGTGPHDGAAFTSINVTSYINGDGQFSLAVLSPAKAVTYPSREAASNRPELVLEYTTGTAVPTHTVSPTATRTSTPTVTLTPNATNTPTITPTPTLCFDDC